LNFQTLKRTREKDLLETYVLNSGQKVNDVMREVSLVTMENRYIYLDLSVLDLKDSDYLDFTESEWTQLREDFLALIRLLDCELAKPYVFALNFLCKVFIL
jgi:hypothetical protein